jgi:hypothetical protein
LEDLKGAMQSEIGLAYLGLDCLAISSKHLNEHGLPSGVDLEAVAVRRIVLEGHS